MYRDHYQTMRLSFEQICQGQTPWVPLGNFMNNWYAYHLDERERLICDPLPEEYPEEFHQWAAFCAASVRWFCSTYELTCPLWVNNPKYILAKPWYMTAPPVLWQKQRETTAEEFIQHNIYCGNRVYTNKYEQDERGRPFGVHPVNLQERRALVRKAAIRLEEERAELKRWEEEWSSVIQARQLAKAVSNRESSVPYANQS
jgi:hypothetical protein